MVRLKGIKNIVFDFGGVLVDLDQQASMDAFAALGMARVTEYLTLYGHKGPFGRLESGKMDLASFRNEIRRLFEVSVSDEEIDRAWGAFLLHIPKKKMQMVHELSKKYRVFLLSNTNPVHAGKLQEFEDAGFPLRECFEKIYLSYEIGLSKPGREIFEYVLKDAGLKPEETLFVDDGPANCKTAVEMGMKTMQPKPYEDFTQDILRPEACVATLGFFDGVHRGHHFLIEETKRIAKEKGLPALIVSFWPHPRTVLHSEFCPQLLTEKEEKEALLRKTGVDYIYTLDFDSDLANLSARQFMKELLREEFNVQTLVVGFDHRFGNNRSEGFENYRDYGKRLGIDLLQAQPFLLSEVFGNDEPTSTQTVSSSLIRRYLLAGKIEEANACLGYRFSIEGMVVGGHRIGQTLGFPTANLAPNDPNKLIPAFGVYAVWVSLGNKRYKGMLNIGRRPTLHEDSNVCIEVHLLHFSGDLYHQHLVVDFVKRFRQEQTFPDIDALIVQLEKDREWVDSFL